MRLGLLAVLLGAAFHAAAAERPPQSKAETEAVQSVRLALGHRDCEAATKRLNAGLAAQYPGVFLMAGTMYEEGLCLKPSWERAERMYLRAAQAGHRGGEMRLVAGLAQAGRDPAAALWWAQQTKGLPMPAECRVAEPAGQANRDPDAFVAALQRWPAAQLANCAYAVGVLATITGDTEYPQAGIDFALNGTVGMRFVPAQGSVSWNTERVELQPMLGVVDADRAQDRNSRSVQLAFERHLRSVSDRALRRYNKPATVPDAWELTMTFVFNFVWR